MSKKLDTSHIQNELEGGSAFFSSESKPSKAKKKSPVVKWKKQDKAVNEPDAKPEVEQQQVEVIQELPPLTASSPIEPSDEVIEMIRKKVKQTGREGQVFRLSIEEKRMLGDIVYNYKRQGIRTSENEVCRIAIVSLLHDYSEKGERSVLARVIDALIS